jgi:hypothetical protein
MEPVDHIKIVRKYKQTASECTATWFTRLGIKHATHQHRRLDSR